MRLPAEYSMLLGIYEESPCACLVVPAIWRSSTLSVPYQVTCGEYSPCKTKNTRYHSLQCVSWPSFSFVELFHHFLFEWHCGRMCPLRTLLNMAVLPSMTGIYKVHETALISQESGRLVYQVECRL